MDVNVQEVKKEMLKNYMKVWCGMTKFIKSQCLKDQIIDTRFFGYFKRNPMKQNTQNCSFIYFPSKDLIDNGKFNYREDESNLAPHKVTEKITK
jgi:hypothetical protein